MFPVLVRISGRRNYRPRNLESRSVESLGVDLLHRNRRGDARRGEGGKRVVGRIGLRECKLHRQKRGSEQTVGNL